MAETRERERGSARWCKVVAADSGGGGLVAGGSTWWVRPKRGERRGEQEREKEICWNELMREKMNGEGFI